MLASQKSHVRLEMFPPSFIAIMKNHVKLEIFSRSFIAIQKSHVCIELFFTIVHFEPEIARQDGNIFTINHSN